MFKWLKKLFGYTERVEKRVEKFIEKEIQETENIFDKLGRKISEFFTGVKKPSKEEIEEAEKEEEEEEEFKEGGGFIEPIKPKPKPKVFKKELCPEPDNIQEFSETIHHEYDLGESAQIHDVEFLIECEPDSFGMFFTIECVTKNNQLRIYRTFVIPLEQTEELMRDLKKLSNEYKCVEIVKILLVFILEA